MSKKDLIVQIAKCLSNIEKDDLTTAETHIAHLLCREGYLTETTNALKNGKVFKLRR